MEQITIVHLPISMSDMGEIETILRAEGPFCTSFPDRDVYSAALYHQESAVHGLRGVAQQLLAQADRTEEQIENALRKLFGAAVYDHYVRLNEQKDDPTRPINRVGINIADHGEQIMAALEREFRKAT